MSYIETPAGCIVTIDLEPSGLLRAANVERRIAVTINGEPRPPHIIRDVLTAATLATLLPAQGALLARIDELMAERDALAADLAEVTADRDALAAAQPAPPVPGVDVISDRQFFQGLALQGLISEDEALAAVATGTVPAVMIAFVDALPPAERFHARMILCGAVEFRLNNPLTQQFGAAHGMTPAEIAALWAFCASL